MTASILLVLVARDLVFAHGPVPRDRPLSEDEVDLRKGPHILKIGPREQLR